MKLQFISVVGSSLLIAVSACSDTSADRVYEAPVDETATALDAPVELQSGVALSGLSGATGDEKQFFIRVPAGATALRFSIRGGTGATGNADLYVRYGRPATRTSYTYRFTSAGNDEVISAPARSGTWYLLVRAQSAYSNVTVSASYTAPSGSAGSSGSGGSSASGGSASGGTTGGTATGGNTSAGSGGLDCSNPASWPADWVSFEDRVLVLVNAQRSAGATCGGTAMPPVPALRMEDHLRVAARCHSLDMAQNAYFDHTSQDGRSPWDRIAAAGYTRASWQGENIAAGYSTPEAVVSGWMSSAGHCTNIMQAHFVDTGVGYAFLSGSPYRSYWTQDFGAH